MAQENKLAAGELQYFWRGKSRQIDGLTAAMFAAFPGYHGLCMMMTKVLLTSAGKPTLTFNREPGTVAKHCIVADEPTIEEDFI